MDICQEVGAELDIDPWLLVAVIERESSGQPDVRDYLTGTHIGLMQLSEYYFGGDGIDLFDPYTNIYIGAKYLKSLGSDEAVALMKYHGETDAETKPISSYAKGILKRRDELTLNAIQPALKQMGRGRRCLPLKKS